MPVISNHIGHSFFPPLQLLAATAPAGWAPSGEFLIDCNVMASSALSHDASLGKALWELSEKATGVAGAV